MTGATVVVVGGGGREHALCLSSRRIAQRGFAALRAGQCGNGSDGHESLDRDVHIGLG